MNKIVSMPMMFMRFRPEGKHHSQQEIDEMFSGMNDTYRDKDYRYLAEIFDIKKLSGTILDVGCALGDGIKYLQSINPRPQYFGTDISAVAIQKCQTKNIRASFFQHNMEKELDKEFDYVICLQSLEHSIKPVEMLKNMLNSTRRSLLLSVPYKNMRKSPGHLWVFDENTFPYSDKVINKSTLFCIYNR